MTVTTTTIRSSSSSKNSIAELLEWNLIDRISPYLDRHMIFPLLDYLEQQIQQQQQGTTAAAEEDHAAARCLLRDINEARFQLLRPTHMIDYRMDAYHQNHHTNNNNNNNNGSNDTTTTTTTTATAEKEEEETMMMQRQKQQVLQDLAALQTKCQPLLEEGGIMDTATRVSVCVCMSFVCVCWFAVSGKMILCTSLGLIIIVITKIYSIRFRFYRNPYKPRDNGMSRT